MTRSMCWRSRYYSFQSQVMCVCHILGALEEFWFEHALMNSFLWLIIISICI
jgi:hypothetical protein